MYEAKNTARALVRIGYDGRVHKLFRATDARQRFDTEVRVLKYLERQGCDFVPRLLEANPDTLEIVTTNCGARVEHLSDEKIRSLFEELECYGVRHEDPYLRNVTYRATDGRFCIIDFEFATILDPNYQSDGELAEPSLGDRGAAPNSVRWSCATDVGRTRPNNEDAFLAITFDALEFHYLGRSGEIELGGMDFVFAVSDGMGGEKSGEFASRFAIDNITRLLPRRFASSARSQANFIDIFQELFHGIHRQLTNLGQSYREGQNMGATLSLIWYARGWFYFAHIGDSRIYYVPAGEPMRQLTEDHTHVGWLRRKGKLNEREARSHPRKNVLSRALGAGHQWVHPQIGGFACQTGDRVVLCTDGVIDGLWDHALEEIARDDDGATNPLTPAHRLVRQAVAESGRDNATAIIIEWR